MLIAEHTVETTASASAIWRIWEDVLNWNNWNHGTEFSTINGPFVTGTTGTLKSKGGPLVHMQLTHVELPHQGVARFVTEIKLPFTRVIAMHTVEESAGKTHITHRIEMRGLLAAFFAFVVGRDLRRNLPQEMVATVKKVEERTKLLGKKVVI